MDFDYVHILLVDDNEDDIFMTQEAFRRSGVRNVIEVVSNGEQALRYLRRGDGFTAAVRPGLVLLDINMPVMNGYEVLRAMKTDRDLATIPVIMLTTSSSEEDVVRSYSVGASSFVTKPVGYLAMVEAVRTLHRYWSVVSRVPDPNARF